MQPLGEKPDASTLALVGFNVSLACSDDELSALEKSTASFRRLASDAPFRLVAHRGRDTERLDRDLDPASASRRTRLVARMDRRHELSGSSARHEEDSPLEAPTFITTSAVPCCQANAQR